MIGLGSSNFEIALYIANRPQLDDYPVLSELKPMIPGEIAYIAQETGNHWRKVFNVSAKLLFELYSGTSPKNLPSTWQAYRDSVLFQVNSGTALLFSKPALGHQDQVHIVCGKTYAHDLGLENLIWIDNYFATDEANRLIVCPYLDYRQLSNQRIAQLVTLINDLG